MADWINKNESSITIRNKLNSLKIYVDNLKTNIDNTVTNINTSIANLKTSDIKLSQNTASKTGLTVNATLDDALNYMMQSTTYDNYVLYKINMKENYGGIVANHPVIATIPNGTSDTYTSDNKGYFLFLYPREYGSITLNAGGSSVIGYDNIPNITLQPPATGTYFREYSFSFVRASTNVRTIYSSDNFIIAPYIQSIDAHIFGGGGAGGKGDYNIQNDRSWAGGGGAGCIPVLRNNINVANNKYITINIGGGGVSGSSNGGTTTFTIQGVETIASKGGDGGSYRGGGSGGSGGGGGANTGPNGYRANGGSGGALGNDGIRGAYTNSYYPEYTYGGTGIGSTQSNVFRLFGESSGAVYASGGGGGGATSLSTDWGAGGVGGIGAGEGGEGASSSYGGTTAGKNATGIGCGGGGGGACWYNGAGANGGNGQQGAVFIRWR